MMKMKKNILYLFAVPVLIAVAFSFSQCSKNANGRNTLSLVDDATVLSLSGQEYSSFLSANPPVSGTADAEMVRRVGMKMASAVQQYLDSKGQGDLSRNFQWEFNLVNNPEANAWCLPGGKIVFYTGILPLTATEAGLAVVMGHEIAHAVLKHGSERMSQQLLVQYGGVALTTLLSSKPAETQVMFQNVYGISSNLGVLAYSRKQENEGDEMGLYFMASAGYDPNEAVSFWERMSAQGGAKPPVIVSTHPSDVDRIKNIKSLIPKAMEYYKP